MNYQKSNILHNKILNLKSSDKKIVSVFPGTFMEYISLPDYCDDPIKSNHYEHLHFLLSINLDKSHHFIVRFHPNQKFLKFNEKFELNKIVKKAKLKSNFDVILPHQNTSSYEIIKNSDYVLGIGSSISVEALRMGKKLCFLAVIGSKIWNHSISHLLKMKSFLFLNQILNLL